MSHVPHNLYNLQLKIIKKEKKFLIHHIIISGYRRKKKENIILSEDGDNNLISYNFAIVQDNIMTNKNK